MCQDVKSTGGRYKFSGHICASQGKNTDRLDPAEDVLDELPDLPADLIPGMMRGTAIDGGAPVRIVLGYMERSIQASQSCHESLGIVPLVRADGHPLSPGISVIISAAASRSAVPVAWVTRASTIRPFRFSMRVCPRKQSFEAPPCCLSR